MKPPAELGVAHCGILQPETVTAAAHHSNSDGSCHSTVHGIRDDVTNSGKSIDSIDNNNNNNNNNSIDRQQHHFDDY
jgi:hypothetical protein